MHGWLAGQESHLTILPEPALCSLPVHQRTLRLGQREWPPGSFGIMAVINRTPDSFYDRGTTYELDAALAAADRLADLGNAADVVCVTSPGLLFDAVQARGGRGPGVDGAGQSWILEAAFPARRAAPMVTLLDGHPHTLAFLAGIHGVRAAHLGVTRFGQSGDLESVYRHHGIDAGSVVAAALDVV